MTIAVSPVDPLNLAMSSLHQYRVSIDGGASWSAASPSPMPSDYNRSGDPSLAFDSHGRLCYTSLGTKMSGGGVDAFVSELNPTTGELLAGPVRVTTSGLSSFADKPWLAADQSAVSPFQDRLYLVWTQFEATRNVFVSYSADHGATWSPPVQISEESDFLPWPAHVAAAPNGDVYVAYHVQTGFMCNPDGVSGKVFVARSTDGGTTFPQKTLAFGPGEADITFNIQHCASGAIPNTDFWMQGSAQAWALPDLLQTGVVSVVANDDPDNVHGSGDDGDVFIARSQDHGQTWGTPMRVEHGPGTSLQVFPTAAIDPFTGCVAVLWYDTRNETTNAAGNYLLDVFYSLSGDGGLTFAPDVQINDVPFDPDANAPIRYVGPPPTRRIGEYVGVAVGDGDLHAAWTGNNVGSQQAIADSVPVTCGATPPPPPEPDPSGVRRNRFVSLFVPQPIEGPSLTALRVRLNDLQNPQPPNAACCPSPDFSTFEADTCSAANEAIGCVRWVGPPQVFLESQDNPAIGEFRAARLQCTPLYHDWSSEGLIHVFGAEVVSSSTYGAENVAVVCKGTEDDCDMVSAALTLATARHGDVAAAFNPPDSSTQPDALDIANLVNKFKSLPGAPSKVSAQLQPNLPDPNADLNALDIATCVDAFRALAYRFSGPCPCPSQVPCDVTACTDSSQCTGPHGAGARCIRTCVSGPSTGLPCLGDVHCGRCAGGTRPDAPCDADAGCPDALCDPGVCGPGFCRDRCERCTP